MLSVAEAQKIILEHARPLPAAVVSLDEAYGLVLAEEVTSDLDMPPFDKAMMDGYALRAADLADGRADLKVIEEITAGSTPRKTVESGQATRIMTGAPIPSGADAVVMVERTRLLDDGRVQVEDRPGAGQNIFRRGLEMRRGDVVLRAGAVLRPQEMGTLATVGHARVRVHPAPRIALLSTGNEVVLPDETPGPGQIRNSHGAMLHAQVLRAGGRPVPMGIARDEMDTLCTMIRRGLESDVLVLSGGVSAGKLDLVPGALTELGVETHFHKVAMKPGKPMLFGTLRASQPPKLVFGLPGNPVSALVCFELFVRPAACRLRGLAHPGPRMIQARLVEDFAYKTDRPTYHPAVLRDEGSERTVRVIPWSGSPDLRALTEANAFVELPVGDHQHRAGQVFPVLAVEE